MRKGKVKRKRWLLPAVLAALLAAGMLFTAGNRPAEAAEESGPYTITVNMANESFIKEDADLKNVAVVIYRIADRKEAGAVAVGDQDEAGAAAGGDQDETGAVAGWDLTEAFAQVDADGSLEALLDEICAERTGSDEEIRLLRAQYRGWGTAFRGMMRGMLR